jgi:D-glycero-D-manno-heptose 1,7-bisphosphate phosphatase
VSSRALFVDRDGIFHELVPWGGGLGAPRSWDEVRFFPSIDGIEKFREWGYRLVLVTNQPDVERGIIPRAFVDELNALYQKKYQLDAVYVCFASSNDDPMKKPNPGMFLQAAKDLSLSLEESFHLGDTERDVEGARRAGMPSILWNRPYNLSLTADYRIDSICDLQRILSKRDNDPKR